MMDMVEWMDRYAEDWRERASDAGIDKEAAAEIPRLQAELESVRAVAKNLLMHLECLVIAIDPDDCGIDTGQAERAIAEAIPAIIERNE